jgi:hypothetical protein
MLGGRQRNIDGIDHVGRQHFLVGAEGMRHGEAVRHVTGARKITAGNGGNNAVFRVLNGGNDIVPADLGR